MSVRKILEAEILRYERLGNQAREQGNEALKQHCEQQVRQLNADKQLFSAVAPA